MKGKKKKTYVITLSKRFMKGHPKEGEPTDFKNKFLEYLKKHTIRGNYELWNKRIEEVQRGEAKLSIRQWSGKPYASKQEIIMELTAENGAGIERLDMQFLPDGSPVCSIVKLVDGVCEQLGCFSNALIRTLAQNDGLSYEDWLSWFNPKRKPMSEESYAIIHFTDFRYWKLF